MASIKHKTFFKEDLNQIKMKRDSIAWRNLVKEVFERDKYECQICENKHYYEMLAPHHIKSVGSGGSDVADNLLTVCKFCHTKIHNYEIDKYQVYEAMKRIFNRQKLTCDEYENKIFELCRSLNI